MERQRRVYRQGPRHRRSGPPELCAPARRLSRVRHSPGSRPRGRPARAVERREVDAHAGADRPRCLHRPPTGCDPVAEPLRLGGGRLRAHRSPGLWIHGGSLRGRSRTDQDRRDPVRGRTRRDDHRRRARSRWKGRRRDHRSTHRTGERRPRGRAVSLPDRCRSRAGGRGQQDGQSRRSGRPTGRDRRQARPGATLAAVAGHDRANQRETGKHHGPHRGRP